MEKTYTTPPLIVAEVQSLPRSAYIEWHSLGLGHMPTTNPRLSISMTRHEWGCISHCTILASTRRYENDDDDVTSDGGEATQLSKGRPRKSTTTDFITIQIYDHDDAPGADSIGNIPPTTSLIDAISAADSDSTSWRIVQGSTYVAGKFGWSVLQALQKNSGWDALTIIPCRAVWGAAAEKGHETSPKRMSLGIVVRRESTDRAF